MEKSGLTRAEISAATGIPATGRLTDILETLEQSGFVQVCPSYGNRKRGNMYRLIDNFTIFHFAFLSPPKTNPSFWQSMSNSPAQAAWRGLSFERLCMQHIGQIKKALGVSGVSAEIYAWRYVADDTYPQGAQIDLLIDRADRVVDICEMKFTGRAYAIDKEVSANLRTGVPLPRMTSPGT